MLSGLGSRLAEKGRAEGTAATVLAISITSGITVVRTSKAFIGQGLSDARSSII